MIVQCRIPHVPNSPGGARTKPRRNRQEAKSEDERTCMRRLGRTLPPPTLRRSPAPTPVAVEEAARCCSPADCSHRAMTASPESPAAWEEAAAAAAAPPPPPPPRWDRFCGATWRSAPPRDPTPRGGRG
ncbi:hypothetical protein PR202_ga22905 [Eleusine coracana subsp. coracana]|uniref:Uncharacterized protein n=1 Tax=Eleusine coracana subsp. coracana TaxID=191504 RepID=A0AAV5D553_ELECO|nr:hypothetical protein PR202_ga22905 [Eleusine coracana subsp. coracana]